MAEDRKELVKGWENLDVDILVRIFKNYFSLHELTTGLAHVCGGWRMACCDPILWNTLDLSHMRSTFIKIQHAPVVYVQRRSDEELTRILKLSLSLSKGNTRTLIFHFNLFLNDDMVTYTGQRCPNLRRLVLPAWNRLTKVGLSNAIEFCRNLESLTMPSVLKPYYIFESIAMNCKNFRELKVMGPIELEFAQTLVNLLPNLKVLSLRCTAINRDALITILDELKSLEVLNISHSYLFVREEKRMITIVRELEKMIKNKASKLKRFMTCMEKETCVMCQRTEEDEGNMRWCKYEGGIWKADEVSSLHL